MIKALRIAVFAFILGSLAGKASASTIEFQANFTPSLPCSDCFLSDVGDSISFDHDLTLPLLATGGTRTLSAFIDGTLTAGASYDSSTDVLNDGTLTLNFTTCDSSPCTSGNFSLNLGGTISSQGFATTVTIPDGAQFQLSGITTAGILSVTITRTNAAGDLTFLSSDLDVSGERRTSSGTDITAVPEPGSLMLLGTGLIAAGKGIRWKKRQA